MKKSELKQIIKEEILKTLNEASNEDLNKLETDIYNLAIAKIPNKEKDRKMVSLANKYRLKGGKKSLGDIIKRKK